MGRSPSMQAFSPKPLTKNPPSKTKLAILNNANANTTAPRPTAFTPDSRAEEAELDDTMDLAEQMNQEVRNRFVSGPKLGEGTYATVYRGHYRNDPSKLVAIKKIKVIQEFKDGITMDAIRELKFLSELSHPNILGLIAVYSTKDQNICMVLEHLPQGDLEQLWKEKTLRYSPADVKAWSSMICQGVWFCHENNILHRDIKGNNILIAADGTAKLADFGLARSFADPGRPMSTNVITLFYRPPELLYGAQHYGGQVDIWSVACVMAELAIRNWFLASETEIGQIDKISEVFGSPTEQNWPGVSKLKYYPGAPPPNAVKQPQPLHWWKAVMPLLTDEGIDLVRKMLVLDPNKRFNARQVLGHHYWTSKPAPTRKELLPKRGGGEKKMAEDLKRPGGDMEAGRADKVARKLDFASMKK